MLVDLSDREISIIQNALNAHWNEAHLQLENNGVMTFDGTKRPLGDIEKILLKQQKEHTLPILRRFENL